MELEPQVMIFDLSGTAETPGDVKGNKTPAAAMNESADEMCEKIERELKKLLPPTFSVQATIQFEDGSLILAGTVAILTWGGSILTDTIKKSLTEQLSPLVKIAVQRVLNRMLASRGMLQTIGPMTMTVAPHVPFDTISGPVDAPSSAHSASLPSANLTAASELTRFRLLAVATAIVFLIQIALLLDKFVVFQWRP